MVRAPTYDENGTKKGAWSKEEDDKLRAYILKYGNWNWREIPKFAGLSRCGKSCRLRWMNYLRPRIKHGNFTKEEEDTITKLQEEHGNKWSLIAAKLPGRTDNEIKNYWHTRLKRRKKKDPRSEQMKGHSNDQISQWEANQSIITDAPILESSPLSPSTSFGEFSSLSSDHALLHGVYEVTGGGLASRDPIEESSGDFWSQPFVSENAYNLDSYPPSLSNGGFVLPYGLHYDDHSDLFYQVIQELPEIDFS